MAYFSVGTSYSNLDKKASAGCACGTCRKSFYFVFGLSFSIALGVGSIQAKVVSQRTIIPKTTKQLEQRNSIS